VPCLAAPALGEAWPPARTRVGVWGLHVTVML
jgi:hypothetical protein